MSLAIMLSVWLQNVQYCHKFCFLSRNYNSGAAPQSEHGQIGADERKPTGIDHPSDQAANVALQDHQHQNLPHILNYNQSQMKIQVHLDL